MGGTEGRVPSGGAGVVWEWAWQEEGKTGDGTVTGCQHTQAKVWQKQNPKFSKKSRCAVKKRAYCRFTFKFNFIT